MANRDTYTKPTEPKNIPTYPFTQPSNQPQPVEQPVNPTAHGELKQEEKN